MYTRKGNAAIFRSKCRWEEKSERPTKYFFYAEMENETIIKNKTQVLNGIENYFDDLYSSAWSVTEEDYDRFIQELRLPKLSEEERNELEGPLTYDERKQILETIQYDKFPGEDGFTVEFYKFLLRHNLVESSNEAYETNELSISQRRGIITLHQRNMTPT